MSRWEVRRRMAQNAFTLAIEFRFKPLGRRLDNEGWFFLLEAIGLKKKYLK